MHGGWFAIGLFINMHSDSVKQDQYDIIIIMSSYALLYTAAEYAGHIEFVMMHIGSWECLHFDSSTKSLLGR